MQIIAPYVNIDAAELIADKLINIEKAGRTCYKSDSKLTVESAQQFISGIIRRGHESVIEHEKITVKFVVDRGVSHEIVRHRIASISQESTRYCNYGADKHGGEITVILPFFLIGNAPAYGYWADAMLVAERSYLAMLKYGCTPQEARSVLPNSLKTEVVFTANMREWRHFFKVRCSAAAHPQMQQVSIPLLHVFQKHFDCVFWDINYNTFFDTANYASVNIISV